MPRGRRPKPQAELAVNGQPLEVQKRIDAITVDLLDHLKGAIKDRIQAGDMTSMTFQALTKELRGLLHAIKKPASTLMYMSAPLIPQSADRATRRDYGIEAGVIENRDVLLHAQDRYLHAQELEHPG